MRAWFKNERHWLGWGLVGTGSTLILFDVFINVSVHNGHPGFGRNALYLLALGAGMIAAGVLSHPVGITQAVRLRSFLERRRVYVWIAGFSALWLAFLYWAGVQLRVDPVTYMVFAVDAHYEGGFVMHSSNWAPFYTLLIDGLLYVFRTPVDAATLISGVSLAVTLGYLAALLYRETDSNTVVGLSVLAVLCYPLTLTWIFNTAFSETVFVALIAMHLFYLYRHSEGGHFVYFILSSLTLGLVVFTRYAGYVLVVPFLAYTIHGIRQQGHRGWRVWRAYGWVLLFPALPMAAFSLRNWLVFRNLQGDRGAPFVSGLGEAVRVLLSASARDVDVMLWAAAALAGLLVGYVLLRPNRGALAPREVLLVYYTGFGVLTWLLLTASFATTGVHPSGASRYLYPVYVLLAPMLVLAWRVFDERLLAERDSLKPWTALVIIGLLATHAILSGPPVLRSIAGAVRVQEREAGYLGFDSSPRSRELGEFFAPLLDEGGNLLVTAVHYDSNANKINTRLSGAMFLRETLYETAGYKVIGYSAIDHGSYTMQLASYADPAVRPSVTLWQFAAGQEVGAGLRELAALITDRNGQPVYLVLYAQHDAAPAFAAAAEQAGLIFDVVETFGAYQVFRLSLTPAD